jgi:hypothetical protein
MGNVHNAVASVNLHRVLPVGPFAEIVAVAVKALNAPILAVANEHPITLVDDDIMREHELAGTLSLGAPRANEVAVGVVAVDVLVAVPIRDVHLAVSRLDRLRRPVERLAPATGDVLVAPDT